MEKFKAHILVVDDDDGIRELVKEYLSQNNYLVTSSNSAEDAHEKVKVISAASIIAKVYRDKFMIRLSEKFSNYAWERNFGYGTKAHLEGLKNFGVTSHHRKGFKPIHKILSN